MRTFEGEGAMGSMNYKKSIVTAATVAVIALLAACAPKPAPAPVAPVKPVVTPRPYPPLGSAANLPVPPKSVDGVRLTVNSNLSPEQAVWSLRSALNVAALNCTQPQHASMIEDYRSFLTNQVKTLRDANSTLDKVFKAQRGSSYIIHRESYQTQIYNYFALPPTMPAFCDAAHAVGQEMKLVPRNDLIKHAPQALAKLEAVFTGFYDNYEKYQTDFVAWQQDYHNKFGELPAATFFLPNEPRWQPAPVVQVAEASTQPSDFKSTASSAVVTACNRSANAGANIC